MTQARGLARGSGMSAAVVSALSLLLLGWPSAGEAAKAKSPPKQQQEGPTRGGAPQPAAGDEAAAQKKQAAIAGRQAYDSGLKNYANGRYQEAVDQITTALKSGGLTGPEMAKALYTRGIAYKKQSKPGLAISDLTSALWLKNGLNGTERETATAERAEAFKMAGLEDTGKGAERVIADSGANASSAGLSAEAIAQASANPASGAPAAPVTRQDTASEAAQDAARARAAYQPVDGGGLQSAASARVLNAGEPGAPAGVASANLVATPQAAPASAASGGGFGLKSVTGFFSNMFGGGSSAASAAAPAPEATVMTASTTPHDSVSSWSSSTTVTGGATHTQHSKQAAVAAAPVAPPAAAPKGKYKVHIAALRSKAEADALAQQLVVQHGSDLTNHVPTVDEAVIGSMGTFYRVRVGGYASQEEPRELCNKLRTSGLDCLVVTN